MRTLLAAGLVAAATIVSTAAIAETTTPLPQAGASQPDAAKKAWIEHAINHLLDGGTGDRADAGRPAQAVN